MERVREVIDWQRCARAIDFYQSVGFKYIETPWRVRKEIVDATIPARATPFVIATNADYTHLVGSAESGFLQMVVDGVLKRGHAYVSASPCFRDNEDDEIHFKDFFKIELFSFTPELCRELMKYAEFFFKSEGLRVAHAITDIGTDLVTQTDQIEIGSYGMRSVVINNVTYKWSYGTGLAEPRFSQALNKQLNVITCLST
jgi:elongation factor P--beta-lysine ligase